MRMVVLVVVATSHIIDEFVKSYFNAVKQSSFGFLLVISVFEAIPSFFLEWRGLTRKFPQQIPPSEKKNENPTTKTPFI